jgi:WD40 repeat protein
MVSSVAVSADGKRIASAAFEWDMLEVGPGDGDIKVWDVSTGQEPLVLKGYTGPVTGVALSTAAVSADGKRIASAANQFDPIKWTFLPGEVKLWDANTGQELLALKGHTGAVTVALSADGKRIVSASGQLFVKSGESPPSEVKVWDATNGQVLHSLKGHTGPVTDVAMSADGKRIASATGAIVVVETGDGGNELRYPPGEVKVWDAETGKELHTLKGHTGPVHGLALSADGKRVVSTAMKLVFNKDGDLKQLVKFLHSEVKVWDADTGQELFAFKGDTFEVGNVAISPDGKFIALAANEEKKGGPGSGEVKVWDAETGKELFALKGHSGPIKSVAISADGKRILSGSQDKTVKVWDAETGQDLLTLKGHGGEVNSVALSANGQRLVSGSADAVKVWEAPPGPN